MRKQLLSDEQHQFLVENNQGRSCQEITDLLNVTFGLNLIKSQINNYRHHHNLKSGLTGRFEKGHRPLNKGVKRKLHPDFLKWCYKKGNRPPTYKPVGTERVTSDGYTLVKVSDEGTPAERWKKKHILLWEREHGPVPEGMTIGFKNQDKSDIRLENLMCITKQEHALMNFKKRYSEDPDVTENNVLITKIERKVKHLEDNRK